VVGWHIDKGNLGAVDLAGLNVAMAVYSPGAVHLTKWRAALYLDAKASESQKNALIQIFSGWPADIRRAWDPSSVKCCAWPAPRSKRSAPRADSGSAKLAAPRSHAPRSG